MSGPIVSPHGCDLADQCVLANDCPFMHDCRTVETGDAELIAAIPRHPLLERIDSKETP